MSNRALVELTHPDGDQIQSAFVDRWVHDRLDRIREYWALGDAERMQYHADLLATAFRERRIPQEAYFDVR